MPDEIVLRDYQLASIDGLRQGIRDGPRCQMLVAPTGAVRVGVTVTGSCGGDVFVDIIHHAGSLCERTTIEGKLSSVTAQGRVHGLILGMVPCALIILL